MGTADTTTGVRTDSPATKRGSTESVAARAAPEAHRRDRAGKASSVLDRRHGSCGFLALASCHELVCTATLEPLIAHAPTLIAPWLGELERSPWTHITYQSVNSCQQLSAAVRPVRPVRACQGRCIVCVLGRWFPRVCHHVALQGWVPACAVGHDSVSSTGTSVCGLAHSSRL